MDLAAAIEFARTTDNGVLVTSRSNGRPQLSNIGFAVDEGGLIRISVTADRAKYRNVIRDPWAALHVTAPEFFPYVVIEGDVTLSEVAAAPDDATVEEEVALYRAMVGEHEDWDEYRAAMVRDRRVVLRLAPTRAYGMLS